MSSPHYVSIEVGGLVVENWLDYRIDSSMLIPADSFELTAHLKGTAAQRDAIREAFTEGSEIRVSVLANPDSGRARYVLQHTGILESRTIEGSRRGIEIRVQGRDLACHLVDSSSPISLVKESGSNFVDLVRDLIAPWGIEVWTDATASRHISTGQVTTTREGRLARQRARRLGVPISSFNRNAMDRAFDRRVPIDEVVGASPAAIDRASTRARTRSTANQLTAGDIERVAMNEARPQAGETVWEYIDRHAQRFGLMVWFDPRGRLIISSPDYGQEPTFRIVRRRDDPTRNNVVMGKETRNVADVYSRVTVYGRTGSKDVTRSRFSATAFDSDLEGDSPSFANTDVRLYRPLVVHDPSVRSQDEALRSAKRTLAKHRVNAITYQYVLQGHGDGQHLYAIDTVFDVDDEDIGFTGNLYCVSRSFVCNRNDGPRTNLTLHPLGTIQL